MAEPPPGDPGELEVLAGAFRSAASAIEPVEQDIAALGTRAIWWPRSSG